MFYERLRLCVAFIAGALAGGYIATGHALETVLIYLMLCACPLIIGFCIKRPSKQEKLTMWTIVTADPDVYFYLGQRIRSRLCHF